MVDPNIILKGAPAPPPAPAILTPVEAQTQVGKLQALAALNQFRQQQVAGAQLKNQQTQYQIAARQQLADAMRSWLTPNASQPAATPAAPANTGAPSPSAVKDALGNPLPSAPAYVDTPGAAGPPSVVKDSLGNALPSAPAYTPDPAKAAQAAAPASAAPASSGSSTPLFGFNRGAIFSHLIENGYGNLVPGLAKSFNAIEKSAADVQTAETQANQTKLDYFGELAAGVKAQGYTEGAAKLAIAHAVGTRSITFQEGQQILARVLANPTPAGIQAIFDPIIQTSNAQRKIAAQEQTAAAKRETAETGHGKEIAELPGQQAQSEQQQRANLSARAVNAFQGAGPAGYAKFVAGLTPQQQALMNFPQYRAGTKPADFAKQLSNLGLTSQQQVQNAQTEARNKATEAYQQAEIAARNRANQIAEQGNAPILTPQALDNWARYAHQTGMVPNVGYGRAGTMVKQQIMNREAQLFPADNLAGNKATFGANEGSLKTLQKTRDAVVAYEESAGKNLDMFLGLAAKMPDSGAPWLNAPLRSLDANAVGSANMAAVKAALEVANNEIAKVTTNPTLVGQLSDAARAEVRSYNPINATYAQTLAIAKVLRQDMENRRQALDDTIGSVKRRMGGGMREGVAPQRTAPAIRVGQRVTLRDGKTVTVTAVHPDGSFDGH